MAKVGEWMQTWLLSAKTFHFALQAAGSVVFYVNTNKMEFMCFEQKGVIFTLINQPLKLVDQFTYPNSNISSTVQSSLLRLKNTPTASLQMSKTPTWVSRISYLPTHPLGQDMTQGQFLSEV